MAQSVTELSSVDGKKHLKRLLMDELTYSLFPGYKGERIATVNDIFWTMFLIQ
jgi:flagellar basal body-associated protein FliL